MNINFLFLVLFLVQASCSTTYQTSNNNISIDEGCEASVILPSQEGTYVKPSMIRELQGRSDYSIEQQLIEVVEGGKKWVKKKADRGCRSANPDDCLVWCLVEVPESYIYEYYMLDQQNNTIAFDTEKRNSKLRRTSLEATIPVLCSDDLTLDIIKDLKEGLGSFGYAVNDSIASEVLPQNLRTALTKFQSDFSLPIGGLDFDTLVALGIEIE